MSKKNSQSFYFYQFLIGIVLGILTIHTLFSSDKVAYVDSAKLFNSYKGSEKAKSEYQKKASSWQVNIDTLTADVKTLIGKYEKSIATMSEGEKKLTRQLIQTKQSQLQNYQRAIQQTASQESEKLTQSVVTEINAYLSKFGKDHNYKLILIANQSGTIAYGKEGTDITDKVLEGLNTEYLKSKK